MARMSEVAASTSMVARMSDLSFSQSRILAKRASLACLVLWRMAARASMRVFSSGVLGEAATSSMAVRMVSRAFVTMSDCSAANAPSMPGTSSVRWATMISRMAVPMRSRAGMTGRRLLTMSSMDAEVWRSPL
jgi:hypothetical protein